MKRMSEKYPNGFHDFEDTMALDEGRLPGVAVDTNPTGNRVAR